MHLVRAGASRLATVVPVFFHQWETSLVSVEMSPALWTIGTEQLLAYSVTVPSIT